MIVDLKEVQKYLDAKSELLPLHTWNKKIKGEDRGKTPIHNEWTSKKYTADYIKNKIKDGFNVGYRIGEFDLVIDLDPRNYDGVNIEEKIADLFGDRSRHHLYVVPAGLKPALRALLHKTYNI